jgi:pimeloyl-ACP methyl ester carboxylesterase
MNETGPSDPSFLDTPQGRRIAYRQQAGTGPGVVFLHGFRSDMDGSKAVHLAAWAAQTGRAFLRFDYSGHGRSEGQFEDGAISDWAEDAEAAITALTTGPQVIVGSSMGGWIGLLLQQKLPARAAGFVGVAAAPDFTEEGMWDAATEAQRQELLAMGRIEVPADHDGKPYAITRRLIEDGRARRLLQGTPHLACPVRLLHGTADASVPMSVPLRLLAQATGPDIRLTLLKDADHRLSTPECLMLIRQSVEEVLALLG